MGFGTISQIQANIYKQTHINTYKCILYKHVSAACELLKENSLLEDATNILMI